MQVLTVGKAREARFDCGRWSTRAANASRPQVAGGGYQHDVYEGHFTGDFDRAADALLSYKIFAPDRMFAHVCTADHRVAVGATIVQRVAFGPTAIETAVRVIEVERTADRAFFAYATLEGHPEQGIASFAVLRPGRLQLEAWSRAGNLLARLGQPVSRALQRALTKEAVTSFCASVK